VTRMNHQRGLDRTQTLMFPERLEDYVGAENPVRFLDAFVASLDLHALGFARAQCAATGRPPYDPRRRCSSSISTATCIGFVLRGCWKRSVRGMWK
jgi:transposase